MRKVLVTVIGGLLAAALLASPPGRLFGTGIHLRVKGQVYAIGLWRLTIDPETGELIDQEYHGRFDVLQPEIIEAICSLLGPEGA